MSSEIVTKAEVEEFLKLANLHGFITPSLSVVENKNLNEIYVTISLQGLSKFVEVIDETIRDSISKTLN